MLHSGFFAGPRTPVGVAGLLTRCRSVFGLNRKPARAAGLRAGLVALVAGLALAVPAREAAAQIGGSRYAAMVVDANSGEEILAINADEPRYPASLTKMMTLYLAFEAMERGRLSPTTRIRVSRHAAGQEPSKLGLRAGSTITVRDAVLALITKSANDAAAALGERLGGNEVQFGRLMTRKARQLGMRDTSFRNASGLPDANQVTTARDMAILSRALYRDFPQRYAYFKVRQFTWNGQTIQGHNRVLDEYDGADGLKTGYIRASGFNLAASAERNGRRIIAVVFGGATSRERDDHVMALLDRGFSARPGRGSDMMMASAAPRLVGTANAAAVAAPALRPARAAARPVVKAPPPKPGRWGVQVGAFSARQDATRAAAAAARSLGTARVERVKVKGNWFYRAQVTGLSAASARQLCDARRGPCMVLQP
ncbi:D-alanyl-D-alanine carboxypeptidase family protein [Teichococcus oryzae]|uniref:D-alanyl-D-alanine carboxypeptidase n=1 Tax=Teichococcus oryzae TaxID=1608942 RepID=A0A5B2TCU9_9PROT|nr:D-alanyl-D-alanine carboxypeptidase family protein [Pseudoroseomonas oryzae]KAA2211904.1 D-alanyl-D-alanine carboxypeptidase [Pseudoroseomonas oryzae]